ncbi:MAG: DNA polymerase III subunit gamma/tau [Bryobacterales bacterium]|nr:DNA polymerase III subunit gamma/tau [Bryobacterales bacterium]
MYQVIARKYRPQAFAELIGQEHVKTTLENAIKQSRIAHGYIFSGQRGTGKTTVARILARCLNCEQGPTATPCGVCSSCREIASGSAVDVIEIDAASNRGINEMRELRENVRYRPARDRYKIFIIDEAHQITSEAFNALLKTLEEPPEWVVFLLCTTEAHKIPITIASRCQQFNFRSVDFNELIGRMEEIARLEGIEADKETLGVLAQAGEGSVRDSLSALDQAIACCGNTLNAAEVRSLLGMFAAESLEQVAQALAAGDTKRMLEIVAELEANGRGLQHFARELARYIRNLLVVKIEGAPSRLVAATPAEQERLAATAALFREEDLTRYLKLSLDLFKDLQTSLQPRLHLEMGLLRLVHAGRLQPIEEALASLSGSAPSTPPKPSPKPAPAAPSRAPSGDLRSRLHGALLEAKRTHLADAIEHSEVAESAAEVVFTTPKMYQAYLRGPEFESAVKQAAGRAVRITVKIGDVAPQPATNAAPAQDDTTGRALAHPEVRQFQEVFPGSQVRTVRNLRENEV